MNSCYNKHTSQTYDLSLACKIVFKWVWDCTNLVIGVL